MNVGLAVSAGLCECCVTFVFTVAYVRGFGMDLSLCLNVYVNDGGVLLVCV